MLRNTIYALIFIAVATAGTFLGAGSFLDKAIKHRLQDLPEQAERYSLRLTNVGYEDMSLSPPKEISFRNVRATFKVAPKESSDDHNSFILRIDSLTVRAADMSYRDLKVLASGLKIRASDSGSGDLGGSSAVSYVDRTFGIDGESFEAALTVDPKDPRAAMRSFLEKLASLPQNGYSGTAFEFKGNLVYQDANSLTSVPLEMVTQEGRWLLRPSRERLKSVAASFEEKLGPNELDYIYSNPLNAPVLLQMEERSQSLAKATSRSDRGVPQRPYARLLLGYSLAKRFGPTFADAFGQLRAKDSGDPQVAREISLGRQLAPKVRSETELKEAALKEGLGARGSAQYSVR